jgi:hypothetical protein
MNPVAVTGLGSLKKRLGEGLTVAPGQSVGQAMAGLGLEAAGGLPVTPLVNDRVVERSYVLQPGDMLKLVPTMGGGNSGASRLAASGRR